MAKKKSKTRNNTTKKRDSQHLESASGCSSSSCLWWFEDGVWIQVTSCPSGCHCRRPAYPDPAPSFPLFSKTVECSDIAHGTESHAHNSADSSPVEFCVLKPTPAYYNYFKHFSGSQLEAKILGAWFFDEGTWRYQANKPSIPGMDSIRPAKPFSMGGPSEGDLVIYGICPSDPEDPDHCPQCPVIIAYGSRCKMTN